MRDLVAWRTLCRSMAAWGSRSGGGRKGALKGQKRDHTGAEREPIAADIALRLNTRVNTVRRLIERGTLEKGAVDYILKPFSPEELMEKVRKYTS